MLFAPTADMAPLGNAVAIVNRPIAWEKMLRIAAWWVVTRMQDVHRRCDGAMRELVCDSVSARTLALVGQQAIALWVTRALKWPAFVLFANLYASPKRRRR